MKKSLFINALLIFFILISCQESNQKTESKAPSKNGNKIPKNIDEDFNTFIKYFNQDSIFQVSRIDFPLKVKEMDNKETFETIERTINKSEYEKIDLTYSKDILSGETNKYTQETKIEKNKATIEIRGIENGIMSDIIFEKKNGKWKLKTWIDQST